MSVEFWSCIGEREVDLRIFVLELLIQLLLVDLSESDIEAKQSSFCGNQKLIVVFSVSQSFCPYFLSILACDFGNDVSRLFGIAHKDFSWN